MWTSELTNIYLSKLPYNPVVIKAFCVPFQVDEEMMMMKA